MTDTELLVLLAVRLAGRGTASVVAEVFRRLGGDPAASVATILAAAEARGAVRSRGEEGRRSLTRAGTEELRGALAAGTTGTTPTRDTITASYHAFLPLNRELLAALATDPPRGREEVLSELVARLGPVLDSLSAAAPRFGGYASRFERALAAARDDDRWYASPGVDSVHTIWFELHEHLLATLDLDRSDER